MLFDILMKKIEGDITFFRRIISKQEINHRRI